MDYNVYHVLTILLFYTNQYGIEKCEFIKSYIIICYILKQKADKKEHFVVYFCTVNTQEDI